MKERHLLCLSLRQPWLWAVLELGKTVENRKWSTKYRGPVLLHASKGCTEQECANAADVMTADGLMNGFRDPRWPGLEKLERGGICGYAEIADVIPAGSSSADAMAIAGQHGADPRWWMPSWEGRPQHGLVLKNVRRLPFVPYPGSLGLFRLSRDVERQVRGVLAA